MAPPHGRNPAWVATAFMAQMLLLVLVMMTATPAAATTLTYKMAPHERACFYTEATFVGEKIAFYFAVQSGGNFDVDYDIVDPRQTVILKGTSERQGDFVFSARKPGEFAVCFSNAMSTFSEKIIDFDITALHETPEGGGKSKLAETLGSYGSGSGASPAAGAVVPPATNTAKLDASKESIQKSLEALNDRVSSIFTNLNTIQRYQRNFRTKEHRDISTVKAAESRLFWFAVIESCMMVGMGVLQVYIIQTFFAKSMRTRV